MHKVLVAEIGREMTVVNAFGDLNTENPKLLGQGFSTKVLDGNIGIGVKLAVTDLEQRIGPVGSSGEIPFYATSSLPTQPDIQKVNESILNGGILPTPEAIEQAVQLIYEEVGDVLVLEVGDLSTNVYSVTSERLVQRSIGEDLGVTRNALTLVNLIGRKKIEEHHGENWGNLLASKPQTPEEMTLSAELVSAAVSTVLQRHNERFNKTRGKSTSLEGRKLTKIRWIVGTGVALTRLPNGLDIMRESIKASDCALFSPEGIVMLLDKDCIIASIGVLSAIYRKGAWQLFRESCGVEN